MILYLIGAGIILCVCLSAIFSASEMAYSSCNLIRISHDAEDGDRRSSIAVKIARDFDNALGAILIGNNLVNIAASSLATVLIIKIMDSDQYSWLSTAVITVLIIIFGETIPKIVAKKNANILSVKNAPFISFLMVIFKPLIIAVVFLVKLLTSRVREEEDDEDEEEHVEELQSILETAQGEGVLDEERTQLVQAAIDFDEISAYEVMTARVDVTAIDIDDDWDEILEIIDESPFSRLPVYEESIDNIIGVLHLNHFFKALAVEEHPDIRSLLMPVCYVYKTMKLPKILSELRSARQHLAVVTDEYSGTLGVLTMEDVLEELVGDIWDETDVVEEEIVRRNEGEFEIDGDVTIDEFLELTGLDEDELDAESETAGGWVVESLGYFPQPGDSFVYENIRVSVLSMDGRRVDRLLVKIGPRDETDRSTF